MSIKRHVLRKMHLSRHLLGNTSLLSNLTYEQTRVSIPCLKLQDMSRHRLSSASDMTSLSILGSRGLLSENSSKRIEHCIEKIVSIKVKEENIKERKLTKRRLFSVVDMIDNEV